MNIALDATPLSISTGGVARYTLELARSLAENFPDDSYWLISDQPFQMPANAPRNLLRGKSPQTFISRRWWLWGLQRELTRLRVDLFHGTDFAVPYLPLRPSVMTVHDLSPWLDRAWQPQSGRVRGRTPWLLRAGITTMVVTPSETIRRTTIERFRLPEERVIAVHLAASEHFRPIAVSPAATPYFLFVGTIEPRKNIACLIQAWQEARRTRPVDLVLAGRVRAGFKPPRLEPGLQLRGPVPEAELPSLYSGALAVVYPSLYEGFGLPVLEAMQCGALVIASNDPAIFEVTAGAAVHVKTGDTRALAQALQAVVEAPKNFLSIRERGLRRAREFSWRRTAERTREVYDQARRVFRS